MRYPSNLPQSSDSGFPWQALFAIIAFGLAAVNLSRFLDTSKLEHLLHLVGWICWCFVGVVRAGFFAKSEQASGSGHETRTSSRFSEKTLFFVSAVAALLIVCGWFV
jgi:hypothetical protein